MRLLGRYADRAITTIVAGPAGAPTDSQVRRPISSRCPKVSGLKAQVGGQVPRQAVAAADHAVGRHRGDQRDLHAEVALYRDRRRSPDAGRSPRGSKSSKRKSKIAHIRGQPHVRQRPRLALELLARLLEVVAVEVGVAEGVDQVAGLEAADLRHHPRQQRVRSDVERDAEEDVGAALVELAGEAAVGDVELEEGVAGLQRIASRSATFQAETRWRRESGSRRICSMTRASWSCAAVRRRPGAPLPAVDRASSPAASAHSSQIVTPCSCR